MVRSGQMRIHSGGGLPDALSLVSTISAIPAGAKVAVAGDVDGDAVKDILITGSGGNYLVFGGDLPASDSLGNLLIDPDGDGTEFQINALALPEGAWRSIGEFDGKDELGNSYADLASATLLASDLLNESGQLEHQVVNVYLGGDRATLVEAFATADIVLEPGRPFFFPQGFAKANSAFFGGVIEIRAEGSVLTVTNGATGVNEVQSISHTGIGGTFTLTFGDETTAPIAWNATPAQLKAALEALDAITEVTVAGSGSSADPWLVTFVDPGEQNVQPLQIDAAGLLPVQHTLLAVTGPLGDSLRLYDGTTFGPVDTGEVTSAGLAKERKLFVLPLAT